MSYIKPSKYTMHEYLFFYLFVVQINASLTTTWDRWSSDTSSMLCQDAVRKTPQVWRASLPIMSGWSVMYVYQVSVGAVRNVICIPFKTSRWLLVGLVLWCGVPSRWVIHPLVVLVNSHVRWNLLIRRCVVPGRFSANRCWAFCWRREF